MGGFVFDGTHSDDFGIVVVYERRRDVLPDTRDRLLAVPGRVGVYDLGRDLQERIITVRFLVRGDSLTDLRSKARNIADWLNVTEVKALIFDDEPDKRYMARPINIVSAKQMELFLDVQVSFLCPSPYAEATSTTTTGASGTNDGTIETPAVITCTMQSDSSSGLTLTLGDESIILETGLLAGDEIIINTENRSLTVNGVDSRRFLNVSSIWFKLPVGDFTITVDPADTTVSVEFRERWV